MQNLSDFQQLLARLSGGDAHVVKSVLREFSPEAVKPGKTRNIELFERLSSVSVRDGDLRMDGRYCRLKKAVFTDIGAYSPGQLVALVSAASKLEVPDHNPKLLRCLVNAGSELPISTYIRSLHLLVRSNISRRRVVHQTMKPLEMAVRKSFTDLNIPDLTSLAYICKSLGVPRASPIYPTIDRRVAALVPEFSFGYLVGLLHSRRKPAISFHRILNRLNRRLVQGSPVSEKSLLTLASALAQAGIRRKSLTQSLVKAFLSGPRRIETWSLFLAAFARLRVRNLPLLNAGSIALQETGNLTPDQAGFFANSLGKLGLKHEPVWRKLTEAVAGTAATPKDQFLVLQGLGRVGLVFPEIPNITSNLAHFKNDLSTPQILQILVACVRLGFYKVEIFETLLNELIRSTNPCSGRHAADRIRLVSFGLALEGKAVRRELSKPALTFLDQFGGRGLRESQATREFDDEQSVSDRVASSCHAIAEICNNLQPLKRVGPHAVTVLARLDSKQIIVDVIADAKQCPVSRELLGPVLMKHRHLAKAGFPEIVTVQAREIQKLSENILAEFLAREICRQLGLEEGRLTPRRIQAEQRPETNAGTAEIQNWSEIELS